MGFWSRLAGREARSTLENPTVSLADADAWAAVFGSLKSNAGVEVNVEKALGCPPVWGAVTFITGSFAALPLQLFRRTDKGREAAIEDPLYGIVHDVVNDDYLTSSAWRTQAMTQVLIDGGRSYTYIERDRAGRVRNLWPLDPANTRVERRNGYRRYLHSNGARQVEYGSAEIIDVPFLLRRDGISHVDPVAKLRNAIGLYLALEAYAAKFFQNGGVAPLALHGPAMSPQAADRAAKDVKATLRQAQEEQRNVLVLPAGHELTAIGFDPTKNQLVEARKFQLLEIARIYNLPPTFLQDLEHGTFSNTEQQDLQFVKHTLTKWLTAWEAELNAKLFGLGPVRPLYVEFNTDGLLRGDFKTRMEGYAKGIQNAILKPNEVRAMENRPDDAKGNELLIQGATVPLGKQPLKPDPKPPAGDEDPNADPDADPGADPADKKDDNAET